MKALKPSHREAKRYLLLKGKDANKESIEEAIFKFIGILGYSKACPQIIKKENKLILSINREMLNEIRAALFSSNKDIQIARVSGMINKL